MRQRLFALFLSVCLCLLCLPLSGVSATEDDEAAFEALLDAENFPESYRPYLRELHKKYPNWVFRAQHTGLLWDTVLEAENKVGTSLVPASSIASWKSCEYGAYNPATGAYVGLDGASWVAASREVLAYYLDPRNLLTESRIFQFENLAYSDVCTAEGVRAILADSFMERDDYIEMFMAAGKASGVSPYHLASRARQEQGKNGNDLGHGTVAGYEGYYNFFNIRAYTNSSGSAVQNGARYAATTDPTYDLPWNSPEKSIRGGAIFLGSGYINREQNTLYLQKFDVTDGNNGYFSHQYMTNILAPTSESATLSAAYSDEVKAGAMEFCIPVYAEMPDEPCPCPTSTGNNDNWLTALSVDGQTLTPTFTMYTTAYELVVSAETAAITVGATANSPSAGLDGVGSVPLKAGLNTVTITVTAASGVTRAYTLSVYRTPQEGETENAPTLTSDCYRIDGNISGIAPGTSVTEFLSHFTLSDPAATLAVLSADGHPVTGAVGTGQSLQIVQNGALSATYPLLVRGDVSGDGSVNSLDLLKIQKQILGVSALNNLSSLAADVNRDGQINALDLLRTQKHILGVTTIEQ